MSNINKLFSLFLVLSTAFLISFCNNRNNSSGAPVPTQDKTTLITSKTWLLTGLTIDPPYDTVFLGTRYYISDIYSIDAINPPCKKDNTYQFNKDSSLVVSEESLVCNPSEATTGKWYFNKEQTELTTILRDSVSTYKIEEISSSTLKGTNSLVYKNKTYTALSIFTPKY